ncbi:Elongation factor 1-delta [Taenia solium]|eukprot:TsM_000854000 transcript=TsM_000854000 gene=TsM_000854000
MECALKFDAHSYHQFPHYHEMELAYMRFLSTAGKTPATEQKGDSYLVKEIQKVRDNIKSSLESNGSWNDRMEKLETIVKEMSLRVSELETQIQRLGKILPSEPPKGVKSVRPFAAAATAPPAEGGDDDDIDLFGSEDEDEANKCKQMMAEQNKAAASKKEKPVAKSMIVLDVKPWDDTTDMVGMEKGVRAITADGLLWGTSKLVPLVHGISKLQIACVVEDDKVGTDFLEENIMELEDYVQSVDVASFNKL